MDWAAFKRDHPELDRTRSSASIRAKRKRKESPAKPPPGGWPAWRVCLRRDDRGRVIPDLANVLIALRGEEQLAGACTFDEMRQHSLVQRHGRAFPDGKPGADPPHETGDDDIGRLQQWLQRMGIPRIGREIVGQAVEVVAREHRFHPVRERLNGLVWDGVESDDRWLFVYFGAEAEDEAAIEYVAAIGKMFLIAMVARVFSPGCQADYMLVLEGDQGILKSSACRVLAGEWFSDSLPENITSKDARQHLRGKLLVEIAELSALSKADIGPGRRSSPGARNAIARPTASTTWSKSGSACSSAHQRGHLHQGHHRRAPLLAGQMHPRSTSQGLAAVRDQLLAEAVVRYRRGERWWPTAEDEAEVLQAATGEAV